MRLRHKCFITIVAADSLGRLRLALNLLPLVSYMNNTKWTRLFNAINDIPCLKRVKYIDSIDISNWQNANWCTVPGHIEFSGGPTQFAYIEWLEIQKHAAGYGKYASEKITNRSLEIQTILSEGHFSYEELDNCYRIYGYRRATQHRV